MGQSWTPLNKVTFGRVPKYGSGRAPYKSEQLHLQNTVMVPIPEYKVETLYSSTKG